MINDADMVGDVSTTSNPQVAFARKRHRRMLMVLVVVLFGMGFLFYKGLSSALDYYLPVNQALLQKASLGNSTFRIEGAVVQGSISRNRDIVNFEIEAHGAKADVRFEGVGSELFKPGIPVVLVGHFRGNEFIAERLMVKHSDVYTPALLSAVKLSPAPFTSTGAVLNMIA